MTEVNPRSIASWHSSAECPWSRCATTGTDDRAASVRNIAARTGSGVCARQAGPAWRMMGARSASAACTKAQASSQPSTTMPATA